MHFILLFNSFKLRTEMREKEVMKKGNYYDVHERPRPLLHLVLSLQHVVAMFGATILVPLIVGLPVSVALFASGIGTLIYIAATKAQVPVYLGSSFAFISAMLAAGFAASQTGIFMVGLVYVVVGIYY